MPRTKPAKPKSNTPPKEIPSIYLTKPFPLNLEERTKLKAMFETPEFRKAWANANTAKPSAFGWKPGDNDATQVSIARIHQMRGWEAFSGALIGQAEDPLPPPQRIEETYPDASLPISAINPI